MQAKIDQYLDNRTLQWWQLSGNPKRRHWGLLDRKISISFDFLGKTQK
jgi:hypothetical protein